MLAYFLFCFNVLCNSSEIYFMTLIMAYFDCSRFGNWSRVVFPVKESKQLTVVHTIAIITRWKANTLNIIRPIVLLPTILQN